MMLSNTRILIFAVIILSQSIYAQGQKEYFGWDLTYESILEKNNVDRKEWIWKWLKTDYVGLNPNYQSPAKKWISEWQGDRPIVSSILIEFPAFHAAERTTLWFFRTKDEAFYWVYVEDNNALLRKLGIDLPAYDELFEQMSSWKQNKPLEDKKEDRDSIPGFIGFLNLFEKDKTGQMLLTKEDFMIYDSKKRKRIRNSGRVLKALQPVLLTSDS